MLWIHWVSRIRKKRKWANTTKPTEQDVLCVHGNAKIYFADMYKLFLARIHNQSVFYTPVTCMHKFEYITRNAKYNFMIYSHVSKSFVCRKQHFFLLFFKIYQMLCYGLKTNWNSHLNNYYFVFVVVCIFFWIYLKGKIRWKRYELESCLN